MSSGTQVEVAPTFAPSLPVPNVQEIVRTDPLQVPERYLRDQEAIPENKGHTTSDLSTEIPIIDFPLLSKGNKEELDKLDMACQEWGFFQVVNHGVEKEVLQGMKDVAAKFFELPLEEKNKVAMPSDDIQGYGHAYVVSEDQILDWSDALILIVYPTHYRKLQFWPAVPEKFKEVLDTYSSEVKRVGEELLMSLSILMGMEKDSLIGLHNQFLQGVRVNYYPPCSMPHKVLGLSPHSDTSTITILMQEDDVTGLQIQKGGEWVSVEPIPNALVVNVGDVLEIWTNGKYKSIEHRAVTTKNKARLSYATFLSPHDDVEVEPIYDIVESHMMYKKVRYGDYLRQSMKMKHAGKAHTQMAKIES
ncbi:oxoglutarate-dependent flavonoid 7-O-demethylase 1-like [Rosa rugosa]|uniref:oxoglutarate-dependent flavonoid 7-O-demethylase 1-like n=1 Tax=Rosa rugosa TaxID=74645 RepID=UPI002B402DA5|nr:oxoglutarate-dependent flavonoid 7-O-demethylase 1-like [Rosa rugosa]